MLSIHLDDMFVSAFSCRYKAHVACYKMDVAKIVKDSNSLLFLL